MITLNVPEMSCGHCKATVEKAVAGVDPAAKVSVDLTSRSVGVTSTRSVADLITALKGAGYEATAA